VDLHVLEACARMMTSAADPAVLSACLTIFSACLDQSAQGVARRIEACGGLEALDALHYSTTLEPALQRHAASIVDQYFGEDYEEGSEDEEGGATAFKGGFGLGGNGNSFQGFAGGFGGAGGEGAGFGTPHGPSPQPPTPMAPGGAGRGRQMAMPAWMAAQQQQSNRPAPGGP